MPSNSFGSTALRPLILIADDSRLVRAILIKHIENLFEFCEALDGEQAWELLLKDSRICIVITDLTMPKLDGYGLLRRIRASEVEHIRTLPVIVVSGSDSQIERDRAKAAGATDLITKSIATAQLLSRLKTLSTHIDHDAAHPLLERSHSSATIAGKKEAALSNPANIKVCISSEETFTRQAETLLAKAAQRNKNFVLLTICLALKHTDREALESVAPSVTDAIGQLLQRSVRQTDCLTQINGAQFMVATGSIHFDAARRFAQRLYRAILRSNLTEQDNQAEVSASCGMVALSDYAEQINVVPPTLSVLRSIAQKRAMFGIENDIPVVGAKEEAEAQRKFLPLL